MSTPPEPRVDPLARPGVISIVLSEAASKALAATGEKAFTFISKCSWPADPTRWKVVISPCDLNRLNDACRVLRGEARAVRIRKIKP